MRIVDDDDDEPVAGRRDRRDRVPPDRSEPDVRRATGTDPDATVEVLRNLWFHTGDLGRLDDDGFLYFVDRKKDYLRRRGENISSFEMERTRVRARRDRATSRCMRSPSEQGEDDVKVTAVLVAGASLTEEELCRWTAERVPYFADSPLRRVPRRPAAQPGRPGAEVPAPRRRRHPDHLGPRSRRRHLRTPIGRVRREFRSWRAVHAALADFRSDYAARVDSQGSWVSSVPSGR